MRLFSFPKEVNMLKAKAYAKANLSLNILGVKNDYHTLDMLNVSFDLFDEISISFREDESVSIKVEAEGLTDFSPKLFAESIQRMLPKFSENYSFKGIDFFLSKKIPPGGGFGGSSAFAAAAARLIAKASAGEEPSKEMLLSLGSDVPFVYEGGSKRVQGIGEIISPVKLPELYLVLVKPQSNVFSKESFATYDRLGSKGEADIDSLIDALKNKDLQSAYNFAYNQLTESSEELLPEISKVKKALRNLDAKFVIMTGSGSGVIALVDSLEIAEQMKSELPKKWWTAVGKTLPFGVELVK